MFSLYDISATEAFCKSRGIDPHCLRRFRNALLKKGLPKETALTQIPEDVRDRFESSIQLQTLEQVERQDSQRDGATKLGLRCMSDGACIEAVILRIISGRTSLCISSQVGCGAGCTFCASGASGFTRNLTATEMLDQVLIARQLLREEGRDLRNVVVMGMGEPLHNETALHQCMNTLRDSLFFNISENHLMVSTVGIADAMERFALSFPNIKLALSLHSARQDVRETLMPIAKRYSLDTLRASIMKACSDKKLMIEYLLLKGINDGPDDLKALIDYLDGIDAHINLIQFNPFSGAIFTPVGDATRAAFAEALRKTGLTVTLRYSLGDDIAAACGQLAALSPKDRPPLTTKSRR